HMSTPTDSFSVVVEVDGRRMTVSVPKDVISDLGHVPSPTVPRRKRSLSSRKGAKIADDSNSLNAPMQGTLVSVAVSAGDTVEAEAPPAARLRRSPTTRTRSTLPCRAHSPPSPSVPATPAKPTTPWP